MRTLMFAALLLCVTTAGQAEVVSYGYDMFGRLVGTGRTDGPLDGLRDDISLDPADNRTSFSARNVRLTLTANQLIQSQDGRFTLIMQGDGNLVLYMGSTALWQSGTSGSGANRAIMQSAGNLVVYTPNATAVWYSSTDMNPGAYLVLQNDGNLVIYDIANRAIWNSQTSGH